MHFSTLFIFTAVTALAAPARFMSLSSEEWTIENMARACNEADTECTWTFSVNTNAEGTEPTDVKYLVKANDGAPASRAIGGPSEFGIFTVASTWSDSFGIPNAWTTLSIIDYERGILVYPAYRDIVLENGGIVEPDQAYIPQAIP